MYYYAYSRTVEINHGSNKVEKHWFKSSNVWSQGKRNQMQSRLLEFGVFRRGQTEQSDLGRSIATMRFCTACAARGAKARSTCGRKIAGYSPTCTCRAVGLFRSISFVVTFSPFDNLDLLWMSLWTPLGSRLVTVTRLRSVFAPSSWFEFIGFIGMAMSLPPATFPRVNTYHD